MATVNYSEDELGHILRALYSSRIACGRAVIVSPCSLCPHENLLKNDGYEFPVVLTKCLSKQQVTQLCLGAYRLKFRFRKRCRYCGRFLICNRSGCQINDHVHWWLN